MALPSIPTSFAPHPATQTQRRQFSMGFPASFSLIAYVILAIVFFAALGVFFYGRILAASQASKDAALAKAEAAIDPATVEDFARLRNRLNSGQTLLGNHVALSKFFTSIENVIPANARFTALHVSVDPAGETKLDGAGVAKNFNVLAAASAAFAADNRIKNIIFSNVRVNNDNSVSFKIAATLDPKIITFSP